MKKLSFSFYVSCLVFWGVVLSARMPSVAQAFWVVDDGQVVWGEGEVLGRDDEKDDRTGDIRVRLERSDDRTSSRLRVRVENEAGEEEELGEQEELRIREREEENETEIEVEDDEFVVRRGQTQATTKFPLSINLATNELVVTTPAGERGVTVLPDQAVQGMLGADVIDQLQVAVASPGAALAAGTISLGGRLGVPVYEILGIKHHKFLGFIPVQTEVTAVVSAETGELVATEDVSLVEQVINLLSVD